MTAVVRPVAIAHRVPLGHGASPRTVFWPAAALVVLMLAGGYALDGATAVGVAVAVILFGGMPHGAFDMLLLARARSLGTRALVVATALYAGVVMLGVLVWALAPAVALGLFLVVAAVHFGEDWTMLDDPLLRTAAGSAVIAVPTLGSFDAVSRLFGALAGAEAGAVIAGIVFAMGPVILLVAVVGLAIAWIRGAQGQAAAATVAFALLALAPPLVGFALFFVFLHSPAHLGQARRILADLPTRRWLAVGAGVTLVAILGGLAAFAVTGTSGWTIDAAQAFRLLAIVALPHLLLSHRLLPDASSPD